MGLNEPRHDKTSLGGFRPGPTKTGLTNDRRWLNAWNFGFRKKWDGTCTNYVVKALISCAANAQLICAFVFAYTKSRLSHDTAQTLPVFYLIKAHKHNS